VAREDNDEDRLVAVSPRHAVRVTPDYHAFLDKAPQRDFVVRTLARKEAGQMLLMTGDLVIAGAETRAQFPLAAEYPLHFRKVYYPGKLHRDPKEEFDSLERASQALGIPPPIGHTPNTFRSCLIPGEPYQRLTPFGTDPEDSNITTAQKLPLPMAVGLWSLITLAFEQLTALHAAGMVHGDAELVNFIVCPSPLEVVLIDFETAAERGAQGEEAWQARTARDLQPLLREAIFLQCALGRQQTRLADVAWEQLDSLFKKPARFRRAALERTGLAAG
jgi:hypothetical protein